MKVILKSSDGFGSIILNTNSGADISHECLVQTKGFCFMCITKIGDDGLPPPPQNLNWVHDHLGLKLDKWLTENGFIPDQNDHPFLLKLNEKGVNFQANICSECASITEPLSVTLADSAEDMDEIVSPALRVIQNKLEESDKSDRINEFYCQTTTRPTPNHEKIQQTGQTSIGRKLRKAIIDKCKAHVQQANRRSLNHGTTTNASDETCGYKTPQGTGRTADLNGSEPSESDPFCGLPVFDEDELMAVIGANQLESHQELRWSIADTDLADIENLGAVADIAEPPNPPVSQILEEEGSKTGSATNIQIGPVPSTSSSATQKMPRRSARTSAVVAAGTGSSQPSRNTPKSSIFSLKTKMTANVKQTRVTFECIFCLRTLTFLSQFELHLRTHTREAPYFCPRCGINFKRTQHLKIHLDIHRKNRKRTFHCDQCPVKFFLARNLRNHQKVMHSRDKDSFNCDSCSRRFKTNWNLQLHQKRHHSAGVAATCEVCGKHFKDEIFLAEHRRLTHGKRYTCNTCQKTCSSKASFNSHNNRIHSSNRKMPFKCDICAKSFHTKVECQRHGKTHVDMAERARPFQCEICNKKFLAKSDLGRHRQIHAK